MSQENPILLSALVVRGIGLGSAMQPAIAGALEVLSSAQVPRATGALNVIQRTGGALGAALLAVVLEHHLALASSGSSSGAGAFQSAAGVAGGDPGLATAFANSFWWAIGLSVLSGAHLTLFPKVVQLLAERDASDIVVFGGGIIPDEDIAVLEAAGVAKVFTPGASTHDIVTWVTTTLR